MYHNAHSQLHPMLSIAWWQPQMKGCPCISFPLVAHCLLSLPQMSLLQKAGFCCANSTISPAILGILLHQGAAGYSEQLLHCSLAACPPLSMVSTAA